MRISSNFKSLSMNWEKYVLHWVKLNFETIMNSKRTANFLALGKTLSKNVYMHYPSRQYVKRKHFKCKFAFNNDFMIQQGAKFM